MQERRRRRCRERACRLGRDSAVEEERGKRGGKGEGKVAKARGEKRRGKQNFIASALHGTDWHCTHTYCLLCVRSPCHLREEEMLERRSQVDMMTELDRGMILH